MTQEQRVPSERRGPWRSAITGVNMPVIVYAAAIALIGITATAYASFRPDVENAPRLADLDGAREEVRTS